MSEQCCGGRVGKHSDFIEDIPKYLLEIPLLYNIHIDIMIEAKKKELSIKRLYQKYPFLNCKKDSQLHKNIKLKICLSKTRPKSIIISKKSKKNLTNGSVIVQI